MSKFKPDYESECCMCEQSPTVLIATTEGDMFNTDMCGPCTFGESKCVDPAEWEFSQ